MFGKLRTYIKNHILNIRNIIINKYYRNIKLSKEPIILNPDVISPKVIVSLTSYPKRFKYVKFSIISILRQTELPNRIILYLDENIGDDEITDDLRALQNHGLEIEKRPINMKPHKKYFYAIKENPEDIIITIDDDCIYNKRLIEKLLASYHKYPIAISAVRIHRILFDKHNNTYPYNKWKWDYRQNGPGKDLFVTGVAGALYPPHVMKKDILLDSDTIMKYSADNDDIWLKFIQIISGVMVVKVNCPIHASVEGSQEISLNSQNVGNNRNDIIIKDLIEYFKVDLYEYTK